MRTLTNILFQYQKMSILIISQLAEGSELPYFMKIPNILPTRPLFQILLIFFFKGGEGGTPTMKLNDIVNKDNNKYHKTIKMNSGDVNVRIQIDFGIENNKFKVADHVRILKYKNLFAKIFWKRLTK